LGQEIAITSPVAGTTTDPIAKTMELAPLGPVTLVDSAGLDDMETALGRARVSRSLAELERSDLIILLLDAAAAGESQEILNFLAARALAAPCIVALNKCDLQSDEGSAAQEKITSLARQAFGESAVPPVMRISARARMGLPELLRAITAALEDAGEQISLIDGLLPAGGFALLVLPMDSGAPKGRLILPQMQTMRAILDHGSNFVGTQTCNLRECLNSLGRKPDIAITDSQDFAKVAAILPPDIPLTSFSILFARYKGDLAQLIKGAEALDSLKPGDKVLIAEACSHHAQKDDIGTIKIPRMLRERCGEGIEIEKSAGRDYPNDLAQYRVIIHCGACMLTAREMRTRIQRASCADCAITNYGVTIAWFHGILERALEPFVSRNTP
jgi:[FeFe] hydrogenase H-cluster maturation GTPase HydF